MCMSCLANAIARLAAMSNLARGFRLANLCPKKGAILLLLMGLGAGCNQAATDGNVAAQPASAIAPESKVELRDRIDQVRAVNLRRYMNTREHAAWQIVHGILAYQDQLKVDHFRVDPATKGEKKERV